MWNFNKGRKFNKSRFYDTEEDNRETLLEDEYWDSEDMEETLIITDYKNGERQILKVPEEDKNFYEDFFQIMRNEYCLHDVELLEGSFRKAILSKGVNIHDEIENPTIVRSISFALMHYVLVRASIESNDEDFGLIRMVQKNIVWVLEKAFEYTSIPTFIDVIGDLIKLHPELEWSFDLFLERIDCDFLAESGAAIAAWKTYFETFMQNATINSLAALRRGFKKDALGDRRDEYWANVLTERMKDDIGEFDLDMLVDGVPSIFPEATNNVLENLFYGILSERYVFNDLPRVIKKMAEFVEYRGYSFTCCKANYDSVIEYIMMRLCGFEVNGDLIDILNILEQTFNVSKADIEQVVERCTKNLCHNMKVAEKESEISIYRNRICKMLPVMTVFRTVYEENPSIIEMYK